MIFRLGMWQITLGRVRVRNYVVRAPRLTELQLTAAFAAATETNPLWLAVNQLVDTLEENVHAKAWLAINEPNLALGYIAAAEHLAQLRDDLLARREQAMPARRKLRRQEESGSLATASPSSGGQEISRKVSRATPRE